MNDSSVKVDIVETLNEVSYLLSDADRKLARFLGIIQKNKKHITPQTADRIVRTVQVYRHDLSSQKEIINACYVKTRRLSSEKEVESITGVIENAREHLRTHLGLFGTLITSTDWQSPTFAHSLFSQAGRETGRIYATMNDYKRDQHWDSYYYEQAFLREYIDVLIKFPAHIFATSSGMAAFTTILLFLVGEKKISGPILAGNSIYFENKGLLTQLFGNSVIYEDETDMESFIGAVKAHKPSVIFIDSLTNSPSIIIPNIPKLIGWLAAHAVKETYLIIDNTGLSVLLQPYKHLFGRRTKLRIITFESLNKYHQFGMDRFTGGIVTSYGMHTGKLFDYRDHGGTNIIDSTAAALPTPNRKLLSARLARHTRNARKLASSLRQWLAGHPANAVEEISYPGQGSYLALKFTPKKHTIKTYKRFVETAVAIAKRHNVNLVSGTSFGLDTTRIYLTAVRSRPNTPFVRIALGTEHVLMLKKITDVFIETLKQFA